MQVDGKKIAEEILSALVRQATRFPRALTLGVVMGSGDAATQSFVRIKERTAARLGVTLVREELPDTAATALAVAAVQKLATRCDGVIVQLPLSGAVDIEKVLAALPPEKDADGISPAPLVLPPVIGAMQEILSRAQVSPAGKNVTIVGKGRLVGAPAEKWFREQRARVSVVHDSRNLARATAAADIIALGAGAGGILTPAMCREGAVILDAGASEDGGTVRGDADPRCADKASVFTPVPGGIGPVAVALLFKNLFELARRSHI